MLPINSPYTEAPVSTARPSKVANLQASYAAAYNANNPQRAQVTPISDLVHGVFPEVFEGIDAVIHVASPLAGREDPDSTIRSAVDGTLNILRQAEQAGIIRIVVTSSIATALNKIAETSDATIKDSGKPTLLIQSHRHLHRSDNFTRNQIGVQF